MATHRDYSAKNISGLQSRGVELELEYQWQNEFVGANKDGRYIINNWGAIDQAWVKANVDKIKAILTYP